MLVDADQCAQGLRYYDIKIGSTKELLNHPSLNLERCMKVSGLTPHKSANNLQFLLVLL
jgi:hypothetical protein